MFASQITTPSGAESATRSQHVYRHIGIGVAALTLAGGIWFGLPELSAHARWAFIIFGLAVIGWCFTSINDTYIALAAALAPGVIGIDTPNGFFEGLGDSMIWLLLAAFMIAAAVNASGLSQRLTMAVAKGAHSIKHLFFGLTAIMLVTAFVIPSTSGRAALMIPVFMALSAAIGNPRITRALALLFPTVILLSAIASLFGAGAHLVMTGMLWNMTGERIGFGEWMMLGLPFALVSCFVSAWVILRLFLTPEERNQPLTPGLTGDVVKGAGALSPQERYMLIMVTALVTLWATESLHGMNSTLVAVVGALAVTAPRFGVISFAAAIKKVEWNLLIFMAATLALGELLVESGGAKWLAENAFAMLQGGAASSAWPVISVVALVSLLSHLLITSRTARSSVLVPIVVLLAVSLGYDPAGLAFLSTVAAGFCLTLMVSAKPVTMFSQLDIPTYTQQDLLRLSAILLPIHFGLLVVFAFLVWPLLGLDFTAQTTPKP